MTSNRRLALQVARLYVELHGLSAADKPASHAGGSFAAKTIGGRRYWYHQHWLGKRRIQKSLGLETPELLARIDALKRGNAAWQTAMDRRRQLCRALKAGMKMPMAALSGRVLAQLAESGLFRAGGVLIGAQAYATYAAMLGRSLAQAETDKSDISLAARLTAAFADAVAGIDGAFFEMPGPLAPILTTALKYRGGPARVELLTPQRTEALRTPLQIAALTLGAQQVPYLDYLIESPIDATCLHDGGIRLRVPQPARFALHKLIAAVGHNGTNPAVARQDLAQSAELMAVLAEDYPRDLANAAEALVAMGGDYLKLAREGADALVGDERNALPAILAL